MKSLNVSSAIVAVAVLRWLFAITLLGPAIAWFQNTVAHAEARGLMNPCASAAPRS